MIKCPCKDCEKKGCGPYHDVCEPYQDYCKNRKLDRKDIKRKYKGITGTKIFTMYKCKNLYHDTRSAV